MHLHSTSGYFRDATSLLKNQREALVTRLLTVAFLPKQHMKNLIETKNYTAIREALAQNPNLANEGIACDENNPTKAHPLHRICDAVFAKKISDDEAVEIAKIFLEFGANVDGGELITKQDSPLVAAASLHADKVGILYLENGANINHGGCFGGTALHWASWCGRPKLVEKLINAGSELDKICIDYKATPLFWAIHGFKFGGGNVKNYVECVKLLVKAGADKMIPNRGGETVFDILGDEDSELKGQLV